MSNTIKFQENDRVQVKKECRGAKPGITYVLKRPNGCISLYATDENNNPLCSCSTNWILVDRKIDLIALNKEYIEFDLIKKSEPEKIPTTILDQAGEDFDEDLWSLPF